MRVEDTEALDEIYKRDLIDLLNKNAKLSPQVIFSILVILGVIVFFAFLPDLIGISRRFGRVFGILCVTLVALFYFFWSFKKGSRLRSEFEKQLSKLSYGVDTLMVNKFCKDNGFYFSDYQKDKKIIYAINPKKPFLRDGLFTVIFSFDSNQRLIGHTVKKLLVGPGGSSLR